MPSAPFDRRSSGVLLPIPSLPGRYGCGDLGPSAYRFVDWLAASGQTWWQVLPIGPFGKGNSPYSSTSSIKGEPLLISLEKLTEEGLLSRADLRAPRALAEGSIRYRQARKFHSSRLAKAAARLQHSDPEIADPVQSLFDRQWNSLRQYANRRGVKLLGDLPMFVVAESEDVRERPELFRLNSLGRPTVVTGVPPDSFSASGQLWGHPHYNWREHRKEEFAWWTARIARQLDRFDAIRFDHFIGLHRCWEVSARARTARCGRWVRSPGRLLLNAATAALGPLPLLAEDLGAVTPAVRRLRDEFGYPGMRILQWGFDKGNRYDGVDSHPEHAVAYLGTHDNNTTAGWFRTLPARTKERVLAATGGAASAVPRNLIRCLLSSRAKTTILTMQDLLGLGSTARTNHPGRPTGNWRWRLPPSALSADLAATLAQWTRESARSLSK